MQFLRRNLGRTLLFCLAFQAITLRAEAVSGQAPYITQNPLHQTNNIEGQRATFTVAAAGTEPLTYEWFRIFEYPRQTNKIADANGSTLTLQNLKRPEDIGIYQAVVRNAYGSATSNPALLNVWPKDGKPIVSESPSTVSFPEGAINSITASAFSLTPLTYQWYKDGALIPGAVGRDLAIGPLSAKDEGVYTAVVTNPYGSATIAPITVKMFQQTEPPDGAPPWFKEDQQGPVTVAVGKPFVLSVTMLSGTPPFTFYWSKDPSGTKTSTTSRFAVAQADFTDAGIYFLGVVNPFGSAQTTFKVIVMDEPEILEQPPEHLELLPYMTAELAVRFATGLNPDPSQGSIPAILRWYRNGAQVWLDYAYYTNVYEGVIRISNYNDPERPGPGDYFAVMSNDVGSITSTVAHVELKIPPAQRPRLLIPPDLKRELVAYWPLDEVDGTKLHDLVGQHDLESRYSLGTLPGVLGNAFYLENEATYHASGPDDDLPINRNTAFTISFWDLYRRGTGLDVPPYFFHEGDTSDPNTVFGIAAFRPPFHALDLLSSFRFVQQPREKVDLTTEAHLVFTDEWRHVIFVQDEDGSRWLYINGTEVPVKLPPKPPGEWTLNFTQLGGNTWPAGTLSALFCCIPGSYIIDDVALWKRALSAEEIGLLNTPGMPGTTQSQLKIEALLFDPARKAVTIHWNAVGDGLYSLVKSGSVSGPWEVVTNTIPYGANGYILSNSFRDAAALEGRAFYQIRQSPR